MRIKIFPENSGKRLDALIAEFLHIGLRQARKLIKVGRVLVDGSQRPKGYKLLSGQEIIIKEKPLKDDKINYKTKIGVVSSATHLAALNKPPFMHSDTGRERFSVQSLLPSIFPQSEACLLNRLDYLTSGILMVALTEKGRNIYKQAQEEGKVDKFYLAQVRGKLVEPVVVKKAIDAAKRKKVKVLARESESFLRFTWIYPLKFFSAKNQTLVRARILKGQRHQIRAHLSFLGHPIVGDPLYGHAVDSEARMYLHHYKISMPGFQASKWPEWCGVELEDILPEEEG
jgi:23S rRNA pseudouridine1911/1915/1917 synthase